MSVSTLVPLSEYLSTAYSPDCEYFDGELMERNVGESDHSTLQMLLSAALFNQRHKTGIHVYPELRVQVAPDRFRVPDILVTTRRVKGHILREPPFLCVEILSPEDRATRVQSGIDDYLRFGVEYIWLIDPRQKKAWIYAAGFSREATDVLTTANPHLSIPLPELFRALEEEIEP